jgi:hypothetical protein
MNYFINQDLYDFFIDHNGVLMMKSQDFRAVYYLERTGLIKGDISDYPVKYFTCLQHSESSDVFY